MKERSRQKLNTPAFTDEDIYFSSIQVVLCDILIYLCRMSNVRVSSHESQSKHPVADPRPPTLSSSRKGGGYVGYRIGGAARQSGGSWNNGFKDNAAGNVSGSPHRSGKKGQTAAAKLANALSSMAGKLS
jgi:hypothetical protein